MRVLRAARAGAHDVPVLAQLLKPALSRAALMNVVTASPSCTRCPSARA